jgi:hypothetical protein
MADPTYFKGSLETDDLIVNDSVSITGNVEAVVVSGTVLVPDTYTVATVPAAASFTGGVIYVSNGAAGAPVLAFSNGTNWLRVDTLAAIAAA